jgi:hypothetical protein
LRQIEFHTWDLSCAECYIVNPCSSVMWFFVVW